MAEETYTGGFIEWIEQWSQIFDDCNWYTFQFAHIEFEWDKCMGGVEASVVILGLGFRARYNYAITDHVKEVRQRIEDIKNL